MLRSMANKQGGPLPSVLDPKPQLPEMSLRRATALLKESNDVGLVKILVQEGVDIEQHSTPSTSFDPWAPADNGRRRARIARQAIGMRLQDKKTATLTPELRSEILSTLLSITTDVSIFNPVGAFIIPFRQFHEMIITEQTTLKHLVNSLQGVVNSMVKNQEDADVDKVDMDLQGQLLVSGIQFKIFNGRFPNLPKIKGILKGTNPIEPPSGFTGSETMFSRQRAYREGELDKKEIPCAESMQWLVGPGSDEERYWEQYRIAMQIDKVKSESLPKSPLSIRMGEKRPLIMVMTVQKLGLLSTFVGEHNFQVCESNHNKTTLQLSPPRNKGKERNGMGDSTINRGSDTLATRIAALSSTISKSELDFALEFAKTLNKEDGNEDMTTSQLLSRMMKNSRKPLPKVTIKPGDEKTDKSKPAVNWGTYQRMGGDPRMHELFPLDDAPFHPQEYYMFKGKHVQVRQQQAQPPPKSKSKGKYKSKDKVNDTKSGSPSLPGLSDFSPLDPNLVEMLMESRETVEYAGFRDRNDLAVGFDENDDDIFILGKPSSPAKPETNPSSTTASFQGNKAFSTFNSRQQLNSPLPRYGGKSEAPGGENQFLGSRAGQYSELFTGLNELTIHTAGSFEDPSNNGAGYVLGNPLNVGANSFRANMQHLTASNIPRPHSRFFPPPNVRHRSPSPLNHSFMPPLHQPVPNVNQFHSFGDFNAATAELSQNYMQHNPNYWQTSPVDATGAANLFNPSAAFNAHAPEFYNISMSPTKLNAQMSRAFNAPGVHAFNGRTQSPFLGKNANQRQGQMPGQTQVQCQGPAQGQHQVQNRNNAANNPVTATPTDQVTGTIADSPGEVNGNTNTFVFGAGTSRYWVATSGTSTPASARNSRVNTLASTGSNNRKLGPGQSQLRADSPSFNYMGGKTISTFLPGIYAAGDGGAKSEETPTKKGGEEQ